MHWYKFWAVKICWSEDYKHLKKKETLTMRQKNVLSFPFVTVCIGCRTIFVVVFNFLWFMWRTKRRPIYHHLDLCDAICEVRNHQWYVILNVSWLYRNWFMLRTCPGSLGTMIPVLKKLGRCVKWELKQFSCKSQTFLFKMENIFKLRNCTCFLCKKEKKKVILNVTAATHLKTFGTFLSLWHISSFNNSL